MYTRASYFIALKKAPIAIIMFFKTLSYQPVQVLHEVSMERAAVSAIQRQGCVKYLYGLG